MSNNLARVVLRTVHPVAKSAARDVLRERLSPEQLDAVLSAAWRGYGVLAARLAPEPTVGAGVMALVSVWTISLYRSLRDAGLGEIEAREWTARCNLPAYLKLAAPMWKFAGIGATDRLDRMRRAMRLMFRFPYGSPGYDMAEVDAGADCVGFDVRRCAMAEVFLAEGLPELCQQACCDLDVPLAEAWGLRLEVAQTLSRGASRCTFRYFAPGEEGRAAPAPQPDPEVAEDPAVGP